jgi:hypothetical protein
MTAAVQQPTLTAPARVEIVFYVDTMQTDREIVRRMLLHYLGCIGDIPQQIDMLRGRR